jgi:kinesin family protein 12
MFDTVFDEDSYQDAVFSGSGVVELVDKAVEGYLIRIANSISYATVVFAYGQTGSGKTFTMTGPDNFIATLNTVNGSESGVIPRAIRYLFEQHVTSENIVIRASYLEIYNEQVIFISTES